MSISFRSHSPRHPESAALRWHGAVQNRRKSDEPKTEESCEVSPLNYEIRARMKRLREEIEEDMATASQKRQPGYPQKIRASTLLLSSSSPYLPQMIRLYTPQEYAAFRQKDTPKLAHSNKTAAFSRASSEIELGSSIFWRPAISEGQQEEKSEKRSSPPEFALPTEDMPLPELPFIQL